MARKIVWLEEPYHAWLIERSKDYGMGVKALLEGVLDVAMASDAESLRRQIEATQKAARVARLEAELRAAKEALSAPEKKPLQRQAARVK